MDNGAVMILKKGEYVVFKNSKTLYFKRYNFDMFPRLPDFKIYHEIKITAVMFSGEQFTRLRMA